MTFAEFLRTPLAEWEDEFQSMHMKLPDKIKFRSLHSENSKGHATAPPSSVAPAASAPQARLTQGEAKELHWLDDCIQRVTELQARMATRDGDLKFVTGNFTLWKALFQDLQIVLNFIRVSSVTRVYKVNRVIKVRSVRDRSVIRDIRIIRVTRIEVLLGILGLFELLG